MKTLFTFAMASMLCLTLSAQKSVNLKFNLENNKTYKLKYQSTENKTTTMQGMTQNAETSTTMVISLKPVDQKEGHMMAQVKFDSMIIENTMPPMKIHSGSKGDLNSSDPIEALSAIIYRLCNSELIAKMTYAGKVIEIVNFDAVSQNIFEGIENLPPQTKTMVEMQAKNMISRDMLNGMIESTLSYLAGTTVQPGDKWETAFTISAGGLGMVTSTKYKLESVQNNVAVLVGESSLEPASNEAINMNGALITSNLRGMGKVTYKVDTKTGWIISGTIKNQISGNMSVQAPGQNMEIPVETISESTITAL
jgi:hypothetical protein